MKPMRDKLKLLAKAALGKAILIHPDVVCEKKRFGSDYGGWDIAVANLNPHTIVYSFGVGEDASFDMELIEGYDLTIHAFDPTPKSIEWVKKQGFSEKFVFHSYGLAAFDGNTSFNPPENPVNISHTILDRPSTKNQAIWVPVKKLDTIMRELGHSHIDIIKMDIEGSEYDVIKDIDHSRIRPEQILVEFHHRFPGVGVEKTKTTIGRIQAMGYCLFSVSRSEEEYSFIRRSAFTKGF